jgi:deoxyribonuclease-4
MFGSHLSIAGGLYNALIRAEELHLETVQIFNKSQRQWRAAALTDADIKLWRDHVKRLKFTKTVRHASYLVNVGSPDQALWQKSLDSLIEEHQRCAALGIT